MSPYFKYLGNVGQLDYTAPEYKGEQYSNYGVLFYFKMLKVPPLIEELMQKVKASHASWVEVALGATVRPHVDHGLSVTCNVYVDPQECVTQFYEPGPNSRAVAAPGETSKNIYMPDDLRETESFLAKPGDVYLLNVKKIHSVLPTEKTEGMRSFVQFAWIKTPYQLVAGRSVTL